jgi:hypothetical protein
VQHELSINSNFSPTQKPAICYAELPLLTNKLISILLMALVVEGPV